MAELTADTIKPMSNITMDTFPYEIANGTQLYIGQFVDTNASGLLVAHVPASTAILAGIVVGGGVPGNDPNLDNFTAGDAIAPGNTSATIPPTAVVNRGGFTLLTNAAVTGAAATQADVGKLVYLSNGNDWSTSATNSDKSSGRISNFSTANGVNNWEITVFPALTRGGV